MLGTIDEEPVVEQLVGSVLESPVDQRNQDHNGPRYLLGIRLVDGTSTVRAFWLESGELSRGIMTDPVVTLSVWQALPGRAPDGGDGWRAQNRRTVGRPAGAGIPEL